MVGVWVCLEEVGDGAGEPIALVGGIWPAELVLDAEGEGWPVVEAQRDAKIELCLDLL